MASSAALAVEPEPAETNPAYCAGTAAPPRLLTVREVAELLRVSPATVYALVERGELAHVRVSNAIRVAATVLEQYLARGAR